MTQSAYKIYNASAGSGKTFTLVKEYLKILLASENQQNFRQILAITFTNKAVNEMKQRILNSLAEISQPIAGNGSSEMAEILTVELNLDMPTLQNRAQLQLQKILHNYAYFDVSTIDKFTHRVIRTFAKDLKIAQNFEVVLDTSLLLEEAVQNLLARAGDDPVLTETLVNFALEKTDEDRHWDLGFDLEKAGSMIFDENHMSHFKSLLLKRIPEFEKLQKSLRNEIAKHEQLAITKARETLDLLSEYDLGPDDFPNKTLPNHFQRIIDLEWDSGILYGNKLEENLNDGKLLKSGLELPDEDLPELVLDRYLDLKQIVSRGLYLKNAYRNLLPLTLLSRISSEIRLLEQERNLLPISSFNKIISDTIAGQPAPFIYERLGERYRHYFIDEFQDTSELQWQNLIPLISNALESVDEDGKTGSLMLVGDIKQAIYRWRGGKPEQMLHLISGRESPFAVEPEVLTLKTNYRSSETIVWFNNSFFRTASKFLDNETHRRLFAVDSQQQSRLTRAGYVQIDFLDSQEEEQDQLHLEKVKIAIKRSLDQGYSYSDICVLTRKKEEGVQISKGLLEAGIPLVSSDTLLIKSSREVRFLINLLRLTAYPEDRDTQFAVLEYLIPKDEAFHDNMTTALNDINQWLLDQWNFSTNRLRYQSLYDGLEESVRIFKLSGKSDAFIAYLLDESLLLEQRNQSGIQAFLDYWDQNSDKISLSTPEDVDAVRIMTIHKAKGLEFPVVIYPFANSRIHDARDPKLWMDVNPEDFQGFSELLFSKKKEMMLYSAEASEKYSEDQHKLELDAFNILYVALTRAIDALFIISVEDLDSKGNHKTSLYSGLFIEFLTEIGKWTPGQDSYSFGTLPASNGKKELRSARETLDFLFTRKDETISRMIVRSGIEWDNERARAQERGTVFHHIMSKIRSEEDLERAVEESAKAGMISQHERIQITDSIRSLVNHHLLSNYFKPGLDIRNEEDIITKNGLFLRPDRLVINQGLITVIDYKTGMPSQAHKEQIELYSGALREMGYQVENKILVYINEDINVEIIK